jgi:hypothetical protein
MAQRLFDPARIAVTLLGRLDGIKLNRTRLVSREAASSFKLLASRI